MVLNHIILIMFNTNKAINVSVYACLDKKIGSKNITFFLIVLFPEMMVLKLGMVVIDRPWRFVLQSGRSGGRYRQ